MRRPGPATVLAALVLGGAAQAAAPRRVVSLNPCLDAILVRVAAPGQIAALSHYSREPYGSSVGVETARRYRVTHESAEEVMALSPDLVLTGNLTPQPTLRALRGLGIEVQVFAVPETVDASLAQVRQVAAVVCHPEQGEAEAGRIRAALAAAAPPPGARPVRALVLHGGGFTTGPGALMDEILRRAGFTNVAREYGLTRSGDVPLEKLLADPPQVLLQGEAVPGLGGWGERVMRHPALARMRGRTRIVSFPEHLMYCAGPNLAETARVLAAARGGP